MLVKECGTPAAWILVWCGIVAYSFRRHGELALHPAVVESLHVVAD